MKLHLPHLLRRAVLRALFAVSSVVTTLASASYAEMITPDGRTATSVVQDGSTYNVYTNTVRGATGFNSFSTFDVYSGTTANLHLADGTGKLINVVRDSASHIDGVLNSYKNGKIGGDVYFLNPNGVFVGKSGVINVGSISMSTPTAAFVEQLIARDGSISPTATQAVMDGDMPINEKGTISVKGKVNAAHTAELRAGTVEVKGGSINTGVKFREMVNTGNRKVDTKGMNISNGKLSFGKKPSKVQTTAVKPKKAKKKQTAIAVFADDVFVDGAELNADSVYIDPDKLELSNLQVSGDYTLEARVIILSNVTNKEDEALTSFTLNAANVQGNDTYEGNVIITLANSNLVGDTVSLNASATGTGADALITISASDIKSTSESGSIALSASSASGAASVNVTDNTTLTAASVTASAEAQQAATVAVSASTLQSEAEDGSIDLSASSTASAAEVKVAEGSALSGPNVSLSAEAPQTAAITLSASTLQADADEGLLEILATSEEGAATVTVEGSDLSASEIDAEAAAQLKAGLVVSASSLESAAEEGTITLAASSEADAVAVSLAADSSLSAAEVSVGAAALQGDATLTALGTIASTGSVSLVAATGYIENHGDEDAPNYVAMGSGIATLTVGGIVIAGDELSLSATAVGTSGNAELSVSGTLTAIGETTETVGDLTLERNEDEIVLDTDSAEEEEAKNTAYLNRYAAYLKSLESATAATAELSLDATSYAGTAKVVQDAQSALRASLSTTVSADAGIAATVELAGSVSGGNVAVTAEGHTAELRVAKEAVISSEAHTSFVESSGGVNSAEQENGSIYLAAKSSDEDDENTPEPSKKDGVLLEVAGSVLSRRSDSVDAGDFTLASDGTLSIADTAVLDASSAGGKGGEITLYAPEYALEDPASYTVAGATNGRINLVNTAMLTITGDNINDINRSQKQFVTDTTGLDTSYTETWFGWNVYTAFDGTIQLTEDVTINTLVNLIFDNAHIYGNGYSLELVDSPIDYLPTRYTHTIGDNVTIENVKDFSYTYTEKSYLYMMADTFIGWNFGLEVGKNFTLTATGDVTITLQGQGNTFLKFGSCANITAGGNVALSATTTQGWGSNFFGYDTATDLNTSLSGIFGDNKFSEVFASGNWFKFYSGRFFKQVLNDLLGTSFFDTTRNKCTPPLTLGVAVSKASVTFDDSISDEECTSITGNTITISSLSTALVGGRNYTVGGLGGTLGLTLTYIYNSSKVTLGKYAHLTATGSDEKDNSLSITSTTDSTNAPLHFYESTATGLMSDLNINVSTIYNEVTIDSTDKLTAEKNLNISTLNTIDTNARMDADGGMTTLVKADGTTQKVGGATYAVGIGANVVVNNNKMTIDGELTSNNGDINCGTEDKIDVELTVSNTLTYTNKKAPKEKEKAKTFIGRLVQYFCEDFVIDIEGLGEIALDGGINTSLVEADNIKSLFKTGNELFEGLNGGGTASTVDNSVAVSIATAVVSGHNDFVFNGKAKADNGSVTLNAHSQIEEAVGAESNISGIPSKQTWTGSVSVPVLMSTCTMEVGSGASITAGQNVSVTSCTEQPMSFDVIGWQEWYEAIHDSDNTAADVLEALRNTGLYLRDYAQSGDFGLLDSLSSSHASSMVSNTGSTTSDSATYGGDVVVDVRSCDTLTLINDGATLSAGGTLTIGSESTGKHVAFAGQLPFFLTLGNRRYSSTENADSGYGASIEVDNELLNTVTYIGKATLTAGQLEALSDTEIFTLLGSVGGSSLSGDNSGQVAADIAITNHLTVTEISSGATITLKGTGTSDVSAEDSSQMWNASGQIMVGKKNSVGIGAAITFNQAYTAALLGNQAAMDKSWTDRWDVISSGHSMPYEGSGTITLHIDSADLNVEAENSSTLVNIGVAGSGTTSSSSQNKNLVTVAGNIGIAYSSTETLARQDSVSVSTVPEEKEKDEESTTPKITTSSVSTTAEDDSYIVSVGGDVAVSTSSESSAVFAGALGVNRGVRNTTATVQDGNYVTTGDFAVNAANSANVLAVDVAAAVASSSFDGAAGSAWNSLDGTTGAYLTGGSLTAGSVSISAENDLTSFSLTMGAAIDFSSSTGSKAVDGVTSKVKSQVENEAINALRNNGFNEDDAEGILVDGDEVMTESASQGMASVGLGLGADKKSSFALGASIARNSLTMSSEAIVTGCSVTSAGALNVTAEDESVITAIGIGTAIAHSSGTAIGAGGVFSFAPVSLTTKAEIVQADGVSTPLSISAGSLTLHATDKHRVRVWSFGGAYGDTAGIGLVFAWGSFSGASTSVLLENVNATLGSSADIQASSDLDATFVSLGASASKGGAVTGMVNYLNFNNQVITTISDSTLTVTSPTGSIKALSEGKRTFTDAAGAFSVNFGSSKGVSGGFGAALCFIYLGGNGSDDQNLTQMLVSGSTFDNAGSTQLLAQATTTGTLALVNASGGLGSGFAVAGTFTWVTDYSQTQVCIVDSIFNKSDDEKQKNAAITAEAKSSSTLMVGSGTLGAQIGSGAGVGLAANIVKDHATTTATMTNSRVNNAKDFTLHASGTGYLNGILLGASASGTVGLGGAGMSADIEHQVLAELSESELALQGALTVKAENISKIGNNGWRFTLANGVIGAEGGGVGVAVNLTNVDDNVVARIDNSSVSSGSAEVTATEDSKADAVTVNAAGGLYAGGNISVALPELRGNALAEITADKSTLADGSAIGITTTTGDLTVQASNTQYMRSHVWTLAAAVNPLASAAVNICVNDMNMSGSAEAKIQGAMDLSVAGDLSVTADTSRTATYTTVAVCGSLGLSIGTDYNGLHISSDTGDDEETGKETTTSDLALVDDELNNAVNLITDSDVTLPNGDDVTVDVSETAMTDAQTALETVADPITRAIVDLGGKTATVGGDVTIKATDGITTTPTVVSVSGGVLDIGFHFDITDVDTSVDTQVNNSSITAGGDITIDAEQSHSDNYDAVGVSIGVVSGQGTGYFWTDKPKTSTSVTGSSALSSTGGSVSIGTSSGIREDFTHVSSTVAIGSVIFIVPSFTMRDTTSLSIDSGVSVSAAESVTIGTTTSSTLNASLYDVVVAGITGGMDYHAVDYGGSQTLKLGNGVSVAGADVTVQQEATRSFGVSLNHVGVTLFDLYFPVIDAADSFTAEMSIGDSCSFTASRGDITLSSAVTTSSDFYLYGLTAIGGDGSGKFNDYDETVSNTITLGKKVKMRAAKGNMTIAADSKHTGDVNTTNTLAGVLSLSDAAQSDNTAELTTDVSIGNGFDAAGQTLTLEALNTTEYLGWGKKVSVGVLLNPYSRNAFNIGGSSSATITLAGGTIDVDELITNAQTDVDIKFTDHIAGFSLSVDVNLGQLDSTVTQTASVTLGTGINTLDITADKLNITAHNKYRLAGQDTSEAMIYGGDFGGTTGNSEGNIYAQQTLNASVTLGSGSSIKRRADVAHYLARQELTSLISATNDLEDYTDVDLETGGVFNANTLEHIQDKTTANATLTLNGSIDTWFDTELTAYSHAAHIACSRITSFAIVPTFNVWMTNTIDTVDTVTINGKVESVGDILIQSGSTKGAYTMVDGTTVTAGTDDTNETDFRWRCGDAVIHNNRKEQVTINAAVRAGGSLGIYNDSSANTATKSFNQTHTSADYTTAATDTAAAVTSGLSLGSAGALYAGLSSAVQMIYSGTGEDVTLRFITAQKIFDGSTKLSDGTWQAPDLTDELTVIDTADGTTTLSVVPITLSGSAVRVVSGSDASVLSGKVYSTAEHGLDVLITADCNDNVQLTGATIADAGTGLIYNGAEVSDAVTTVAGPDLYNSEGISIRDLGSGKLCLSGTYELPYNTLSAFAEGDLSVTGSINSGSVDIASESNIIIDDASSDFCQWGAAEMYSALMTQLENKAIQQEKSDVSSYKEGKEAAYSGTTYSTTLTEAAIKAALPKQSASKGVLTAAGTVTITGKIVDLNGKIYSGYATTNYVIPAVLQLVSPTSSSTTLTVAQANQLYKQNSAYRLFKLSGVLGISLCYDAENQCITLESARKMDSAITITGTIVNSDYTGDSGLYVATGYDSLNLTNNSTYTLNIGAVDFSERREGTITLNNTQTGVTTVYTGDASGNWTQTVTKANGSKSSTSLGKVDSTTYTGVSDYQLMVQQATVSTLTESGRLSHSGSVDKSYVGKTIGPKDTTIGSKNIMVDSISVTGTTTGKLTSSYVTGSKANTFSSSSSVSNKEITKIEDPGLTLRWVYGLKYTNTMTHTLYLDASHDVNIHFGSTGNTASSLTVTSGNIALTGNIQVGQCNLTASESITTTAAEQLQVQSAVLTATTGDIGSTEQALNFTADSASFTAGGNLYLETQDVVDALNLKAGKSLYLSSGASLSNLSYHAGNEAVIQAKGDISFAANNTSSAAYTTLSSDEGSISLSGADLGILSLESEGNISISTSQALTVDRVESRSGDVSITAKGGITSTGAIDLTNDETLTGTSSTSLLSSIESAGDKISDTYEEKLQYYITLYYEQDADGNYTYRDADGNLKLDTADSDLAEIQATFRELYDSGRGDLLGSFMLSLSGTKAVSDTVFETEEAALTYLAQHSDKLESTFAKAYYNNLMAAVTQDILSQTGNTETVNYGDFDDTVYRLYWLTDTAGKYVNQDAKGNFVSPDQLDGYGNVIGKVYSDETCAAITAQFKSQKPTGTQPLSKSSLLKIMAETLSGYTSAANELAQLENGFSSVAIGKAIDGWQTSIRASEGTVTLDTGSADIGADAFRFTISPIGTDENGNFVYSDWANTFMAELKAGSRAGTKLVSVNSETGERLYAMSYFEARLSTINELEYNLLQQAASTDIREVSSGLYRVATRNYIGIDAQNINLNARSACIVTSGDIDLDSNSLNVSNLILSTDGSVTGSALSTTSGSSLVQIYAGAGIGNTEQALTIGGNATYALTSEGDIYLKTSGDALSISAISGENVSIDATGTVVTAADTSQPNIIGRRIDFTGDLNTGLSFRSFGTSADEGGLHWTSVDGGSQDVAFNALNTAYTFYFVREDSDTIEGTTAISYTGNLNMKSMKTFGGDVTFTKVGEEDAACLVTFGKTIMKGNATFGGNGAFTALFSDLLKVSGNAAITTTGDAILRFNQISLNDNTGDTIHIVGQGESLCLYGLPMGHYVPVKGNLSVQSVGDLGLTYLTASGNLSASANGNITALSTNATADMNLSCGGQLWARRCTATDAMTLSGAKGVQGKAIQADTLTTDSSNAGVFLYAYANDISGNSNGSFVADVISPSGGAQVLVHDVSAKGYIKLRNMYGDLTIGGTLSGVGIELYSTGAIIEEPGTQLEPLIPGCITRSAYNPDVVDIAFAAMNADLYDAYLVDMDQSANASSVSGESADEKREEATESDEVSGTVIRYTDGNGNSVSQDTYSAQAMQLADE